MKTLPPDPCKIKHLAYYAVVVPPAVRPNVIDLRKLIENSPPHKLLFSSYKGILRRLSLKKSRLRRRNNHLSFLMVF